MTAITRSREIAACPYEDMEHSTAFAYNQAGEKYGVYADGDPRELHAFQGQHAYGDRRIWVLLDEKMRALRSSGAQSIRILDLGCGPGTWLRRIATRAWALGFTSIIARGIDISDAQVRQARTLSRKLTELGGVELTFEVGDIRKQLPEADASIDLCLCLYGVLNHIPSDHLPAVLAEVARVTCGHFIMTVRAIGSTPTSVWMRSKRHGGSGWTSEPTGSTWNSIMAAMFRSITSSLGRLIYRPLRCLILS
jgi:SAM-dependent methyltransferase